MFHKVKSVSPLADFKLSIQFSEGVTNLYDNNVTSMFERRGYHGVLVESSCIPIRY